MRMIKTKAIKNKKIKSTMPIKKIRSIKKTKSRKKIKSTKKIKSIKTHKVSKSCVFLLSSIVIGGARTLSFFKPKI